MVTVDICKSLRRSGAPVQRIQCLQLDAGEYHFSLAPPMPPETTLTYFLLVLVVSVELL